MQRAWLLLIATGLSGIGLLFFLSGTPPFVWVTFLAFGAALIALYICSDGIRQTQYFHWWRGVEDRLVATWLGRRFRAGWGRKMAYKELEHHLDEQRRERAVALAQRFDLVGHGAAYVAARHGAEAGADFAVACARTDVAKQFWLSAYQRHLADGRMAMAAEAADAADLYREAIDAWHDVPAGGGLLRAARLSERLGYPREAIRDYVAAQAGGSALRLAEARGLVEELIAAAETSGDPAIWRIAGELSMKRQEWRAAVGFLRRAGDLRMTLLAAKRGGLDDVVRDVQAILDARLAEERKHSLPGGYFGPA